MRTLFSPFNRLFLHAGQPAASGGSYERTMPPGPPQQHWHRRQHWLIWLLGLFSALLFLLLGSRLAAAPPAPSDARAEDYVPGDAAASRAEQEARPDEALPTTAQEKRNWLLARLIVEQNFAGEQIQATQRKLAGLTNDQLNILVRVYQEKVRQREVIDQARLNAAKENLANLQAQRDAVAQDVDAWRAMRQAQYVNFGVTYGGTNSLIGGGALGGGLYGFGPGYSGGYGWGGYGPLMGFGLNYGYGPNYGYGGYGGYGVPYPAMGGFYSGFGAGF